MAGTFQDGFPLDVVQAVQAATFLTQQERDEWMQWLTSATPEDKAELVNTLHEIWIENNVKTPVQSAPQPVSVPPAPAPVAVQQAPVAVPAPIAPPPVTPPPAPQPVSVPPAPAPVKADLPPRPVVTPPPAPVAQPEPKVETPKYSFKNVEETTVQKPQAAMPPRPQAGQGQQPGPRRDDRQQDRRDPRNQGSYNNDRRRDSQVDTREDRQDSKQSQGSKPVIKSGFADVSKMQTEKTRSILDKFVTDFSQARRNEEDSLSRLKDIVLGIEEVTNYSDLLAEKILALNTSQVEMSKAQTKAQDKLMEKLEDVVIRTDDVQTMVERAQEEIDRLARRQRAFETDVKEVLGKVNEMLSGSGSDTLTKDDKVAILARRLDRLEEVKNAPARPAQPQLREERKSPSYSPVSPVRSAREQLESMEVEVPTTSVSSNQSSSNFMPLKLGNKGKIEE